MTKIDVFAHVLPSNFYTQMKQIDNNLLAKNPYLQNDVLTDIEKRKTGLASDVVQVISNVNLNPEDYVDIKTSVKLCNLANEELINMVKDNDIFVSAVAMLPMNSVSGAIKIIDEQITKNDELIGVQLFTRALNKPITSDEYEPIFAKLNELNIPIWLHPVFDESRSDNNITFSWEYELTQAMYNLVKKGYFQKYPNLKILVHHAGAMIPFFSQRIKYTMSDTEYNDFKKFYVDTALLGNPKALELTVDFFKASHVLFGTDAPFGIPPFGATNQIVSAIDDLDLSVDQKNLIYSENLKNMLN
ncbi:amidohydrolase [Companilactobacillus allii]|uniref:4-oxalomesaconate hydratase n=1 Tax=Companilactobacillus allii TaxID=1847728 RepID=A0A1P8Q319_9LACO|nr:amidohydrolase family protein [Companilactobacillus allii]APX72225.1 4-oxalomesaconate hydratase [Companilactobacillus allii]USQ69318.1 amidohydrolase [Companilactobacillus allii]